VKSNSEGAKHLSPGGKSGVRGEEDNPPEGRKLQPTDGHVWLTYCKERTAVKKIAIALILFSPLPLRARDKKIQRENLDSYIQRMQQIAPDLTPSSPGSLWTDNGRYVGVARDDKATRVGDVISIVVAQDVTAQSSGNIATTRTYSASSGIGALPGQLKTTGVANLFSPTSAESLAGKSQAATTSTLRTQLAGRVVALLPSGMLVVEAERVMTMNNEKQTVLLRGLVRPTDLSPANTISSNLIGNLEFELNGKGVLSNGTRPPNIVIRTIMRILNF
jgi:flagellar L-ring protein FlgH